MFNDFYRGRRVLVTGHTGFKGSWLCQWLLTLGAEVQGYALAPPTSPSLFEQLGLSTQIADTRADIRDRVQLTSVIRDFDPEIVFHLAAQPLVRYSYQNPIETYETNVMGSIYVLEALRISNRPCVAVMVTTDKCYENREWVFGYREVDPMGGRDPYSSSKGMAELAIAAYRRSYFGNAQIRVASVRAGNVIGGGDWALDRIVPDCVRALQKNEPMVVRNPAATRPWQHVLEPLHGYLTLAHKLHMAQPASDRLRQLCSGFNFGPESSSNRTVRELVDQLLQTIPGSWLNHCDPKSLHEAHLLHLCIDKAKSLLGWTPNWDFATSVKMTAEWYQQHATGQDVRLLTQQQISTYAASLAAA
ncbi:MAG: CDP-glucose 4,6-dehydratase [Planctomycetales bacterium]|nr:CDP-glucose 4,6-dehydratase [Planctomycetales bacterium]